jgi:hypothetical protein
MKPYRDEAIERLHSALPDDIRVTLLADQGFGDQQRYKHLALLGWDYVIRFREGILVTDAKGTARSAIDWLPKSGRATLLKNARVTRRVVLQGGDPAPCS